MEKNIDSSKTKLLNPMVLVLFLVLFLLAGTLVTLTYFENTGQGGLQPFGQKIDQLAFFSGEIALGVEDSLANRAGGSSRLVKAKEKMTRALDELFVAGDLLGIYTVPDKYQNKVNNLVSVWAQAKTQIDIFLSKQKSIKYIGESSTDISVTMSAIQEETEKVVTSLLRISAPAGQVTWAQRLTFIAERISHGLTRFMHIEGRNNLGENVSRDIRTFNQVLNGLLNGDRSLGLAKVTNPQVIDTLKKIEELFHPVFSQLDGVVSHSSEVSLAKAAAALVLGQMNEVNTSAESMASDSALGLGSLLKPGLLIAMLVLFMLIAVLIIRSARKNIGETGETGGSNGEGESQQEAILQLLDEIADLADGDLRVQATVTESFTGAIADSINYSIDQMRALVSQINETTSKVSQASVQTKKSASNLSVASQRQAKEIADVSTAVDEMAISIDKVSSNAAESSSVAEKSVEIANKGAQTVQNTIDGMDRIRGTIQETAKRIKRLGESSQEIGDIVSLINEIADQTNILSLNAAIQASMAGDAGKGFAVVADEVQRLAERSGAAAKQISALVKTIQSDTNEAVSSMEQTTTEVVQGTRLAQEAGVALGEIEGVSKSMEDIIGKISQAAGDQAVSAGKISQTMKSIQETTSHTTEGTRATATAIGNLAEMTEELRLSVTGFKLP